MTDAFVGTRLSALVLQPDDDVAVLIRDADIGETIFAGGLPSPIEIVARSRIPAGHKVLLRTLRAGEHVRKYGEVIGRLTADTAAGEHVHVHNLTSLRAGVRPDERAAAGKIEATNSG